MKKVAIIPFLIMGISVRTTNQDQQALKDITNLWQRFGEEGILEKIPHRKNEVIYSLYTDYDGDHTQPYTTVIGCEVTTIDKVPEGMVVKKVEGGRYWKSSAKGDLMKGIIGKHWNTIWNTELKRSYLSDFEVYDERTADPSHAEVDFYIGIND